MRSLHQMHQSLLLSVQLVSSFKENCFAARFVVNNRDSSSAAISSDTLTALPPSNSPLMCDSSSLVASIRPSDCGLSLLTSLLKKPRHQFIRWRPNTNPLFGHFIWQLPHLQWRQGLEGLLTRRSHVRIQLKWRFSFFLIIETTNAYLKLLNLFFLNRGRLLNSVKHPHSVSYVTLQQHQQWRRLCFKL